MQISIMRIARIVCCVVLAFLSVLLLSITYCVVYLWWATWEIDIVFICLPLAWLVVGVLAGLLMWGCGKRPKVILASLLAWLCIPTVICLAVWSLDGWIHMEHRFPLSQMEPLTEQIALDFTKQALIADGKWSPRAIPLPYNSSSESPKYFSANTMNGGVSGSVLWGGPGDYSVTIEKKADQVVCRVYKTL